MTPIDYTFILVALGWAVSYNNVLRFDKNLGFQLASVIVFSLIAGVIMLIKVGIIT